MPKRPVRDATLLSAAERTLLDDFIAKVDRALERRKHLAFERVTIPSLRPEDNGSVVRYRNQAGSFITAEEYERTRDTRDADLDELERALLPLAMAESPRLEALFRPDVHPRGPLAPGAFAANSGKSWMESADDRWEHAVTWCGRLRDGQHDRAICLEHIGTALHDLKVNYNAFENPVPEADAIESALQPVTEAKRARGVNSVAEALARLLGTGAAKDTIMRALERSDELANQVPVMDEDGTVRMQLLDRAEWIGRTVQQEELKRKFDEARKMSLPALRLRDRDGRE